MSWKLNSLALAAGILAGCSGGDGGGGGNNPPSLVLAKFSGDGQNATVANALNDPFCAKLTEDGAAKSGATVTWATGSGGSMNPTSTTTAADGSACSTLTLGQAAGAQTATATSAGASGSPLSFGATATAAPATSMAKNGGDGQQGDINTDLGTPVSVLITDQFGNPVAAEAVTWAVASGSATVNPTSGQTNVDGVSNSTVSLLGTAGPIEVTATSGGLIGSPQTFNLTSVTPTPPPGAISINVNSPGSFSPSVDTVAVGGTVTWVWVGSGHSVTSTGNTSFVSDPDGVSNAPHSYGPITFNTAGTYYYYCTQHGSPGNPPGGMSGRIVVK